MPAQRFVYDAITPYGTTDIQSSIIIYIEIGKTMQSYTKALMTQFPYARGRSKVCKNIGDYVQSIAARQYLDHVDEYIEQEEASNYYPEDEVPAKMIMNGWFQWRAENWPPSPYIKPLLVSMHISPLKTRQLLTDAGKEFLRKNGPVGCRDLHTKQILEENGIPAYFSGCLTLTLGKNYSTPDDQRSGYYFVDSYFPVHDLYRREYQGNIKIDLKAIIYYIRSLGCYLKHRKVIRELAQRDFFKKYSPTGFLDRNKKRYRPYYKATLFYMTYSHKFTDELLLNAEYITHWVDVDMKTANNDDLLNLAETLVKKYSSAKLVVTSRIHAGLPCLGMNTPVIFVANREVTSDNGNFNTPGRLGGLINFFRILNLSKAGKFSSEDPVLKKVDKVTIGYNFSNKENWKPYAEKLRTQCEKFMKNNETVSIIRGGAKQ